MCASPQSEKEGVVEWVLSKHAGCSTIEIPLIYANRSNFFWPLQGFGAGAFLFLIQVGDDQI